MNAASEVFVVLSERKRVRHIAIWGKRFSEGASPLCGNQGDFDEFGFHYEYPGIPICTRCAATVREFAAFVSAES